MNPTSYSVALELKLEMCPPRPSSLSLARITIANAFQRVSDRIRRSINKSPGMTLSSETGIVLRKGVVMAGGRGKRSCVACFASSRNKNPARSGLEARTTASRASIHSRVSWGSTSCIMPNSLQTESHRRIAEKCNNITKQPKNSIKMGPNRANYADYDPFVVVNFQT